MSNCLLFACLPRRQIFLSCNVLKKYRAVLLDIKIISCNSTEIYCDNTNLSAYAALGSSRISSANEHLPGCFIQISDIWGKPDAFKRRNIYL